MLRRSLDQMTNLSIPSGVEWELLIVNNGCTDSTDEVITASADTLPIRRVFEPNPGLSHARNAAVREARGDYILWTDDDVWVDKNWLSAYVEAFERWPAATFFGGPVLPHFTTQPPTWLENSWPRLADAYGERNFGDRPFRITGIETLPYGANFVVRTREQRSHLYDSRLGHCRENRIGGEETALLHALLSEKHEGHWVPAATVLHHASPERMTTSYIRGYFFGHGRCLARTQLSHSPWRLLGQALKREVKYRKHKYRWYKGKSRSEVWVENLIRASMAWGQLCEWVRGSKINR